MLSDMATSLGRRSPSTQAILLLAALGVLIGGCEAGQEPAPPPCGPQGAKAQAPAQPARAREAAPAGQAQTEAPTPAPATAPAGKRQAEPLRQDETVAVDRLCLELLRVVAETWEDAPVGPREQEQEP